MATTDFPSLDLEGSIPLQQSWRTSGRPLRHRRDKPKGKGGTPKERDAPTKKEDAQTRPGTARGPRKAQGRVGPRQAKGWRCLWQRLTEPSWHGLQVLKVHKAAQMERLDPRRKAQKSGAAHPWGGPPQGGPPSLQFIITSEAFKN